MAVAHPTRHLLRAKDLADARYREPLDVETLARAARLSPAHFSREFRRAFGEPPHRYLSALGDELLPRLAGEVMLEQDGGVRP